LAVAGDVGYNIANSFAFGDDTTHVSTTWSLRRMSVSPRSEDSPRHNAG
jgi:hypothetical protein